MKVTSSGLELEKNDIINIEVYERDWKGYLKDPERFIADVKAAGGCEECAKQYIEQKIRIVKEQFMINIDTL
ncbi:MAG: hypothetical protein QXO37_09425 [Candidatus Nitrosocaldaceae archaeon]